MEEMKPRDPAKVKIDKSLDRFLGVLIKTNDQYVSFNWVDNHYEIMTKSGNLYFVNEKTWEAK